MEFSKKLYELRKMKGMSQEELGSKLNVSRQTISKWELGESTPELEKLISISDYFEISMDELVFGNDSAKIETSANHMKKEILLNKIFTNSNKTRMRKIVKIIALILGIFLLIDFVSFIIYIILYGFPS